MGKLELEGGRGSPRLLGLSLGGGDPCLKDCDEVGRSDGGSQGGGGRGCSGSLLLLQHGLNNGNTLTGGGSHGLDDGRSQVLRSDVRDGRSDGDDVEVKGPGCCHDGVESGWIWAWTGAGWALI
jgi:hypothetical protein